MSQYPSVSVKNFDNFAFIVEYYLNAGKAQNKTFFFNYPKIYATSRANKHFSVKNIQNAGNS